MDDFDNINVGIAFEDLSEEQEMAHQGQDDILVNTGNLSAIDQRELDSIPHLTQSMENGTNTRHSPPTIFISNADDADDDIIMIDLHDASQQAQRRWAEHKKSGSSKVSNKPDKIKQEPKEDQSIPVLSSTVKKPVNSHQLLAAQRTMLARNAGLGDHDVGLGSSSNQQVYAEGSSRKKQSEEMGITDEHASVDTAMRFDDDDNSWMNADPDEDEEYRYLTENRNTLERRRKNKEISANDLCQLLGIENRLQTLDSLKAASEGPNISEQPVEEESLFVEDNVGDQIGEHHMSGEPATNTLHPSMNGMDVDDFEGFSQMLGEALDTGSEQRGAKKSSKPRKKPEKRAKDAREFHARETLRRENDRTKARHREESKAALAGSSKTKGKGRAKKNATSIALEPLPPQGNPDFQSGTDNAAKLMLENLMANNPIEDRINNPIFDVGPEPEITDGKMKKATQFQRLFANIPNGGCQRTVRNEKKKLQLASRSFGYAKVRAVDGKWLVKGMKSTLYHHQLLGAHWMLSREVSGESPNGGLLADSMGLGKTIQTLACMVGNPPSPDDLKRRTKATLIVVPAAVIAQWDDEIKFHVEDKVFRKVFRYKASSNITVPILQDCDIVITSYTEVMKEFPFPDSNDRANIQRMSYKEWISQTELDTGFLHKIKWYRVVLDEAHAIKNNSSRTSLACQNLRSIYRWCLTGTPILNRVEELFPYLRFLKANYAMDWQTFQKYFCDFDTIECQNRLSAVLSYTMMRRTMGTTIMNRPIITLPVPHPKVEYINFSQEEKIIYRITENRFRQTLNMFIAKGDIRRKYGIFMVQLLRLRQCTSHPFMLERTIKESWTSDDVAELKDKLSQLNSSPTHRPFYEQTRVWVNEAEASRAKSSAGEGIPEGQLSFGRGSYGTNFNMDKALEMLSEKELYASINCGICQDVPQEPMGTNCGHVFCRDCLESYMNSKAVDQDDIECPTCNTVISQTFNPAGHGIQEDDEQDAPEPGPKPRRGQGKQRRQKKVPENSKGRDAMGFEPYTPYSTWLTHSDTDSGFPLVPSAKTAALKSILLKGFTEAPLDKVVIYVQFRTLARIVGRMCKQEGWNFLYLSGDCTLDHRSKALKMFRDDPEVPILIAGLKCGGLGLNFPWANRCISLDLWWNHGVEQQAFGRIFRIGQKKETYMTRIIVKDSVDMRLLTMQAHKLRDVDRAITETDTQPGLSLHQLANLFGFLKTDADGEIVAIEADYQDDDDPPSPPGSSGV
ncbi:uncharacterized protein BP5553_04253 [Venustampulla echinocandica]|uniref:P-loop containing nucleoside triphosphate hydrolase n=1 Tax=Venustampulla echinocandica TaxID=2656787 RepID=A0A370TWL0_9HELO|nr:uncharacterized protein BP5553_04253 [Venustampulla echinocandica]RDL39913.1 hypothetical protein BP5553_04253 [Venustampulla echinocandica]